MTSWTRALRYVALFAVVVVVGVGCRAVLNQTFRLITLNNCPGLNPCTYVVMSAQATQQIVFLHTQNCQRNAACTSLAFSDVFTKFEGGSEASNQLAKKIWNRALQDGGGPQAWFDYVADGNAPCIGAVWGQGGGEWYALNAHWFNQASPPCWNGTGFFQD